MDGKHSTVFVDGVEFALPGTPPWGCENLPREMDIRVGWRCLGRRYSVHSSDLPGRLDTNRRFHTRQTDVNVLVRYLAPTNGDGYGLLVDLWGEARGASGRAIERLTVAFESVKRELIHAVGDLRFNELKTEQEFIRVRLPKPVADNLRSEARAPYAIGAYLESDKSRRLTPTIVGQELMLGPEASGVVAAVRRFLDAEAIETRLDGRDSQHDTNFFDRKVAGSAVMLAVLLVRTWWQPLDVESLIMNGVLASVVMATAMMLSSGRGLRGKLSQAGVAASLGFYSVHAFGTAYAICELLQPGSLGAGIHKLGYAFLLATGVGIAGGVIGDSPTGFARIVAHVQLLLFIGGVGSIIAVVLRIRADMVRRSEGEQSDNVG